MHSAGAAVARRDGNDALHIRDRQRPGSLGDGPAIDLTGNSGRTRAVPTGGDRSDGGKTVHLRGLECVGIAGPAAEPPTPQRAACIDGAGGRWTGVDLLDVRQSRNPPRTARQGADAVTQLAQRPGTPAGDRTVGVNDASVIGPRGERHSVVDARHSGGKVAAARLTPPELTLESGPPTRHGAIAVQRADVKLLMRMVTAADADDALQSRSAQPFADAVLAPAGDATVGPYSTRTATGGGDEAVPASGRAPREHRAPNDRGPIGFGETDFRIARARAG